MLRNPRNAFRRQSRSSRPTSIYLLTIKRLLIVIEALLLTFHSNHGPISHRFRDKGPFQSKISKFSYPRIFRATLTLELGIGAWSQKN